MARRKARRLTRSLACTAAALLASAAALGEVNDRSAQGDLQLSRFVNGILTSESSGIAAQAAVTVDTPLLLSDSLLQLTPTVAVVADAAGRVRAPNPEDTSAATNDLFSGTLTLRADAPGATVDGALRLIEQRTITIRPEEVLETRIGTPIELIGTFRLDAVVVLIDHDAAPDSEPATQATARGDFRCVVRVRVDQFTPPRPNLDPFEPLDPGTLPASDVTLLETQFVVLPDAEDPGALFIELPTDLDADRLSRLNLGDLSAGAVQGEILLLPDTNLPFGYRAVVGESFDLLVTVTLELTGINDRTTVVLAVGRDPEAIADRLRLIQTGPAPAIITDAINDELARIELEEFDVVEVFSSAVCPAAVPLMLAGLLLPTARQRWGR